MTCLLCFKHLYVRNCNGTNILSLVFQQRNRFGDDFHQLLMLIRKSTVNPVPKSDVDHGIWFRMTEYVTVIDSIKAWEEHLSDRAKAVRNSRKSRGCNKELGSKYDTISWYVKVADSKVCIKSFT